MAVLEAERRGLTFYFWGSYRRQAERPCCLSPDLGDGWLRQVRTEHRTDGARTGLSFEGGRGDHLGPLRVAPEHIPPCWATALGCGFQRRKDPPP